MDTANFIYQEKPNLDDYIKGEKGTVKGSLRPDMVVNLPGGRNIVIDSKVPLSAYLDAVEADSEEKTKLFLNLHAGQVKAHINQLSSKKYWKKFTPTPEFVVLFIPGKNYFSAALSIQPDLIEKAIEKDVVLATPTTLISMLKAVSYGWRLEKRVLVSVRKLTSLRISSETGKNIPEIDPVETRTRRMTQD